MLVAGHSALESAALTVRAMPVYEKPPARPVDTYISAITAAALAVYLMKHKVSNKGL